MLASHKIGNQVASISPYVQGSNWNSTRISKQFWMKNIIDKPSFEALCNYKKVTSAGRGSFSGSGSTLEWILTAKVQQKPYHTIFCVHHTHLWPCLLQHEYMAMLIYNWMQVDCMTTIVVRRTIASLFLFSILLVYCGWCTRLGIGVGHLVAIKWK